ncbi:PREDICTED: metal tolerance protein B [Nicotiana attenuata]|uniref:Metal tolerance protein b n=1 Tax=Nicotiana attenuata TaxID=49451 RepID=A0A1J6IBH1_NICAT|nr:PREDICTED: metal tolerance protein B [Nicotiana attenuata]OIT02278.1 metal tolerance protein b [Nicotiana attenuata]
MEQHEDSKSEIKQLLGAKCNGNGKRAQSCCNPICSFSEQEHSMLGSRQRSKSTMKLCGLIIFYVIVMAVETIGGVKAHSLAVLTDAAHLLSDVVGFSISLFAVWVSGWDATKEHSFGYHRLEVLGALLSVQLIWLVSGLLIYEAIQRMFHPQAKVNGKLMFAIAAFGLIINFVSVLWLGHDHSLHCHSYNPCKDHDHDHDHEMQELHPRNEEESLKLVSAASSCSKPTNINIEGAYLHVISDLIQSVGVMIAGAIMWFKPEWLVVDLLCTIFFSIFALSTTIPMLRIIFSLLMEKTPEEVDIVKLENGLKSLVGLQEVHDLHVWAITVGKIVLSCHVVLEPGVDQYEIIQKVREYCDSTYRIHHVTIQVEPSS